MHQALYRKYRPLDFEDVVGQNSVVLTLKNSIMNNKINHAYMFYGPRGTGKTTISKIFARSINCLDNKDGCSCGKCDNCLRSYEKECVDIIELDAASNNGVDEIREIINNVSLVPSFLKYKVYIIDEVHMLSSGAFNALLKTLEEPPEHVVFILATTEPQKVPETIVSRCQCFPFKRISKNLIVEDLKRIAKNEKIEIDDDVLEQIAISSNGGMRDSLVLLDQLSSFTDRNIDINVYSELNGSITYKDIDKFINNIFTGDIPSIINNISLYNNKGKNLVLVINQIINYLRNYVVDNYSIDKNIVLYINFINYLNENIYNLKNSDNVNIYFESLIFKFIYDNDLINNKVVIECKDEKKKEKKNIKDNIDKEIKKVEKKTKKTVVGKKIINTDEIIKARINNVFAKADKTLKNEFLKQKDKFNDYIFDNNIGYLVSIFVDSTVLVVSDDTVLFGIKYDSSINQLNQNFGKLSSVFKKILKKEYLVAYILESEWEKYSSEYVSNIKNGIKYELIDEPDPIYEEIKNDDIIPNSAINLFGDDIVEIN